MTNTSEVWIIVERGWEYNDEYYYRSYTSDGSEGHPSGAYLTKEAAEEDALKANIQQFKDFAKHKYWRGKTPTDPAEIHQGCLEEAQEYGSEDREDFIRAIEILNEQSPGLIENPHGAEEWGWAPKLSRPLTDAEIALFMSESDIGDSYVTRVDYHLR